MMILRAILDQTLPRLASLAPLARLIFAQWECPAIRTPIWSIFGLCGAVALRRGGLGFGDGGDLHGPAGAGLFELLFQLQAEALQVIPLSGEFAVVIQSALG